MYYRVAIQVDAAPTWQWKSTAPSSLSTLLHFLRLFRTLPHDQLRVFSFTGGPGGAARAGEQRAGIHFGDGSTISPAAHAPPTDGGAEPIRT